MPHTVQKDPRATTAAVHIYDPERGYRARYAEIFPDHYVDHGIGHQASLDANVAAQEEILASNEFDGAAESGSISQLGQHLIASGRVRPDEVTAAVNPTELSDGFSSATDRYEDGTPGRGEQYTPGDRYGFDDRVSTGGAPTRPAVGARPEPMTVEGLRQQAEHFLVAAERAEAKGNHGDAALYEHKAAQAIRRIEFMQRNPPPSPEPSYHRAVGGRMGFQPPQESYQPDDDMGSGFGGYLDAE